MSKQILLIAALVGIGVIVMAKSAQARTQLLNYRAGEFAAPIAAAEMKYGIPSGLLLRQLNQESGFDPSAHSRAGAQGIAQFMPGTAAEFNLDPLDPIASIDAAARYMVKLYRSTGSWRAALAAYNWGIGNWKRSGADLAKAPDETRQYVARIAGDMNIT